MYQERVELTETDILEKEFKIDPSGYRMTEVDMFLDIIMKDYHTLKNIIKQLEKYNKKLEEDNKELRMELRNLKCGIEAAYTNDKEITNIDLLRRISQLEKIVLGKNNSN